MGISRENVLMVGCRYEDLLDADEFKNMTEWELSNWVDDNLERASPYFDCDEEETFVGYLIDQDVEIDELVEEIQKKATVFKITTGVKAMVYAGQDAC